MCSLLPLASAGELAATTRGLIHMAELQASVASNVEVWASSPEMLQAAIVSLQKFARAAPAAVVHAMRAELREKVTAMFLDHLHQRLARSWPQGWERMRRTHARSAAEALGWEGSRGDPRVVSALLRALAKGDKSADDSVCASAVLSLGRAARQGDATTMGKLLKDALLHRRACTGLRLAAEKSIACLLPPGDTMFASRLKAALLNGAKADRRVPLARLLAQAAGVGNSNMLASLKRGLRHSTCDVRISAAAGLGELAQKGDRQTINALVSALDSTELWGCGQLGAERDSEADAIASALARLSPTGDRIALEALRRKLLCNAGCDIPSFDAGIKAIHVLAQGTGDGSAISALLAFLGCRPYWQLAGLVERPQGRIYGPTTCRLAVDAICEIAVPNCDGQVVRAVGERVTHSIRGTSSAASALVGALLHVIEGAADQRTAAAAAAVLRHVAPPGGEATTAALLRILARGKDAARAGAAVCLGWTSRSGDGEVVAALVRALLGDGGVVREGAAQSLGEVALPGDAVAATALVKTLRSGRVLGTRVLKFAAAALGRIAVRGDEAAVAVLLQVLSQTSFGIDRCAAEALGHVAFEHDARVIEALVDVLQTADSVEARLGAAVALRNLGVRECKRARRE